MHSMQHQKHSLQLLQADQQLAELKVGSAPAFIVKAKSLAQTLPLIQAWHHAA